jgi:putative oxidoreductase
MFAIGMLLLRVVVGLTVAAHGAQKLFGLFHGHGIAGTTGFVESLGFRPARAHAYLLGGAETVGGCLLALGLFTPAAAAVIIGVMTAATIVVHRPNGFFATDGGYEFPLLIAVVAITVALVGPGRYALDSALGIRLDGVLPALVAAVVGVMGALGVLAAQRLERTPWRHAQPQH